MGPSNSIKLDSRQWKEAMSEKLKTVRIDATKKGKIRHKVSRHKTLFDDFWIACVFCPLWGASNLGSAIVSRDPPNSPFQISLGSTV